MVFRSSVLMSGVRAVPAGGRGEDRPPAEPNCVYHIGDRALPHPHQPDLAPRRVRVAPAAGAAHVDGRLRDRRRPELRDGVDRGPTALVPDRARQVGHGVGR